MQHRVFQPEDADWLRQKYVVERLTTIEIAKLRHTSNQTVGRALKLYAIKVRNIGSLLKWVCPKCGTRVGRGKRSRNGEQLLRKHMERCKP